MSSGWYSTDTRSWDNSNFTKSKSFDWLKPETQRETNERYKRVAAMLQKRREAEEEQMAIQSVMETMQRRA